MKKREMLMGCLTALLMMASCASHKDVVYFEDMIQDQGYPYDASMKPPYMPMTDSASW